MGVWRYATSHKWKTLFLLFLLYIFADTVFDYILPSPDRHMYMHYLYPGLTLEEMDVTTEDGYVLRLFLVYKPGGVDEKLPPVYLQHGYGATGFSWLFNGETSAATVLANRGFKVYLLNGRGTPLSLKHRHLDTFSAKYWDFSFEDLGYDIVATMKYIRAREHNKRVVYIGVSQGGMQILTAIGDDRFRQGVEENIFKAYPLAPVICTKHHTSVMMRLGSKYADLVRWVWKTGGITHFGKIRFPENPVQEVKEWIMNFICGLDYRICFWAFWDSDQTRAFVNMHAFGSWDRYHPVSASFKTMVHFAQVTRDGQRKNCEVRRFDYGEEENMIRYGHPTPPLFNFSSPSPIPVHILFANADRFYSEEDTREFEDMFYKGKDYSHLNYEGLGHMGFTIGTKSLEVFTHIADDILKTMKKYPVT